MLVFVVKLAVHANGLEELFGNDRNRAGVLEEFNPVLLQFDRDADQLYEPTRKVLVLLKVDDLVKGVKQDAHASLAIFKVIRNDTGQRVLLLQLLL